MRAIKELDYHPNSMARGLRGVSTKVIGVVAMSESLFLDYYMTIRLAGINSILSKAGYCILIVNYQKSEHEGSLSIPFRLLKENRVDGLIFWGSIKDESDQQLLSKYKPIVYTGVRVEPERGFRIYMGNYNYSRDMYGYLLANGHSKILTIFEINNFESIVERRLSAYRDVCATFHIPPEEDTWIDVTQLRNEKTKMAENKYNRFIEGGFTAIFTDNTE